MPNGVTPAGLIGKGMRLTGARGALGISDIDASAMQVLNMLSGYSTKLSERRLSGGEQATKVEKEQKRKGDLWGYGAGTAAFLASLFITRDPVKSAKWAGLSAAAVRKVVEDLTRLDVGVGGIALGEDELPLPPKPKYYKSQYGELSTKRGEAKLDLESLYQAGRQMALPRSLYTGYNVYRGANFLSDVLGLGVDKAPGKELDYSQNIRQSLFPDTTKELGYGGFSLPYDYFSNIRDFYDARPERSAVGPFRGVSTISPGYR